MAQQARVSSEATLAPDVSDSASEAEQYRRERDYWRHLFEELIAQFPDPAFTVDAGGRVTQWNEVNESFLGVSADEAVGEHAYELVGTESESETLAETVMESGEAIREAEIRSGSHPDGEDWHIRAKSVPLEGPDGDVVGAFEVVTRVTDLVEQRKSM
jgi:methyl-accepting chemotaxis protein